MAYQRLPGLGAWLGSSIPYGMAWPAWQTTAVMDATGEMVAFCGRVSFNGSGNKDITKIGFMFGTVVKAGGSTLTVSLQDLHATSNNPTRPDETPDQSVTIANADAAFASDTWMQTVALSANRTVANGTALGVVFSWGTYGGSDSVILKCLQSVGSGYNENLACTLIRSAAGTWSVVQAWPNVILEFSDGSFGTLEGAFPLESFTSVAYKQDTGTADEYGMQVQLPIPFKIDGVRYAANYAAGADHNVAVYGTTDVIDAIEGNWQTATATTKENQHILSAEVTFNADTAYKVSIRPDQTTANVTLYYFSVNTTGHFQAHAGGANWHMIQRLDLGAWGQTNSGKSRPFMAVRISSLDDGVGGASGGGFPILGGSIVR